MSQPGWSMPQSIDRDRFGFLANPKNWVLRSIALSWCSTAGKGSRDYRFARQRGDACGAVSPPVDECVAVAKADGVTLPGDVDAAVRKIAETAGGQYSSTAQDLARGKRSEIDHLNGFIVRRGEALGVATPANRLLHAIVKLIESK